MSTHIGRFEILSEIVKSDRGSVYKATDPENGQTVALKTLRLDLSSEQSRAMVERVVAEAESTKSLNSGNIAQLYGAGEIDGLLCATMEYVQGNSVATMLERKEGFSIWDLLDISRQVCQGLDHAHSHDVVHYSLEPAKVMVQWDGNVKILGFGVSTMGLVESDGASPAPTILHYASPEDVSGGTVDARSNFYTWGAVLYEMVTDLKAFDGEDTDTVRRKIMEEDPVPPVEINNKIHPAVSDLIMKALAKAPEARFQNGQELIEALERCKQASTQPAKKASTPAPGVTAPKASAAAAAKFAGASAKPAPSTTKPSAPKSPVAKAPQVSAPEKKAAAPKGPAQTAVAAENKSAESASPLSASAPAAQKASAAAVGSGSTVGHSATGTPRLDPSSQFITSCVKASVEALEQQEAQMSAAVVEEPAEAAEKPQYAIDPMMAGDSAGATKQVSFSDMEELPPLKEAFWVAPAPSSAPVEEAAQEPSPLATLRAKQAEKPKVQPREVAQKAIKEIKSVPPKLMIYSLAGAAAIILLICVGIAMHVHSQNAEDEGTPAASVSAPVAQAPAPAVVPVPASEPIEPPMPVSVAPVSKPRSKHKTKNLAPAAVAIIPGQLSIDSTPEGAQLQIDGRSDPTWVTPYNVTGLTPGQHNVSVNKSGFTSESRTVDIASGSKSFLTVHLAQMAATVSFTSDPTGASIFINGKDSGRVTPTQLTVEKGSHTFVLKKSGYLDETTTADLQPGQTFRFSPSLKRLGNVDDIKTVGKFKKFFGGGDVPAGMGVVTIKTQPKGAQIAINQRMLDKSSPVQFVLGPGNYVIDISLTGYKPVHRVVDVEQGNKVALDEVMEHE